jgi:apolipoprotein N-acyltransferase
MRPHYDQMLDDLLTRTRKEARAGAKIIVWSEVAGHILKEDETAVLEEVRTVAREEGIYLQAALNVILQTQEYPYGENRLILIDPAGEIVWDYYKTEHPLGDKAIYAPGPGIVPSIMTPFGRLSTVNCFDADYPALLRQVGLSRADLLLVPSHDWDTVKTMHVQIHAFRAIENGVAMLRPTGDGISIATDHLGRILAITDDFATVQPTLLVDMPMQGVVTLYARIGDLFVYVCVIAWVILVAAALLRRRAVNVLTIGEPLQV